MNLSLTGPEKNSSQNESFVSETKPTIFSCPRNSEAPNLLETESTLFPCPRHSKISETPNLLETTLSSKGPEKSSLQNESFEKSVPVASGSDHQAFKRRLEFEGTSSHKSSPQRTKKIKVWRPCRAGELTEDHFNSPRKAKRNFRILSAKCKEYQRKVNNFTTKTWKLKKKIKSLESLFSHLAQKNLISETTAEHLSGSASDALQLIMERRLQNKKTKKFCPELKAFALTLHFYSAKAVVTLSRMQSINQDQLS